MTKNYYEALEGYLDPNMENDPDACEEVWERILEELLADAYSGINYRGIGATQYTDVVNQYMTENGMGKGQIQENGTRQTNGPPATQERYSADEGYVDKSSSGGYDFTKPFGAQLDDFLNGVFPQRDTFIIGPTPDILERVGLAKLPVTMDRKHVSYALEGTYPGSEERKKDHMMEKEDLENILEKIADPVAIIQDRQTWQKGPSGYSVDVLIDMEINGKKSLIPVNVNQSGYANGKEYDSNKLTTIHGDVDTELRLANALNEHSDENIAVFYINKAKANEFLQPAGHPISRTAAMLDGFVASVTDTGSNVKMRIHSVTESRQFKDWFGDWLKDPESASKVVNMDGTPKIMYHGTSAENGDFYEFDETNATKKGGLGLKALGKGNYFTAKKLDGTERYGSRVIAAYLDIKKPFVFNGGTSFLEYAKAELGLNQAGITYDFIQKEMRNQGYDGVIQYDKNGDIAIAVTFDSNQIKSATENIGTFDKGNPDIRYSVDNESDLEEQVDDVQEQKGSLPEQATRGLMEAIQSMSGKDIMNDEKLRSIIAQYTQDTTPAPKKPTYKVDRGNLKKAITSELGLTKEQKEQLTGILNQYAEDGKPPKRPVKKQQKDQKADPDVEVRATKSIRNLKHSLQSMFSIPAGSRAEINSYIDRFAQRIIANEKVTYEDRQEFFQTMYEAGMMEVEADTKKAAEEEFLPLLFCFYLCPSATAPLRYASRSIIRSSTLA